MQTTWNLSKYFYSGLDDPKLTADIARILPETEAFAERYRGKIKNFRTTEEVLAYYEEDEQLSFELATPMYYLHYRSSLDTQDTEIQKRLGELEAIGVEANEKTLFISQEWKELGYERIMAFANDPKLVAYRNALISKADNLRYLLGEREEFVLNAKSRALSMAESLREELGNSYEYTMTIHGETKTMTEEEVRSYRMNPDREIRSEAYRALRRVYSSKQAQITFGQVYSGIVKDWVSDVKLRGFSGVMAPRNVGEELETETVDMLIHEAQAAYPLFARYIEAKRKLLRLDAFYNYDTGAPLSKIEKEYNFDDAVALHLEAMREFDQEFYDYSVDMLESGRVDAFPRYGKQSGAFASYRRGEESFILLNHTNRLQDVATLSHELGHAIHGHLSQGQKDAVYHSPLSLAETASIFSEMLLSEKIKRGLSDSEKAEFLNEQLSDFFATIFRQVQYVAFERRVHEAIIAGQELTYKDYNVMWREEQVRMVGTKMLHDVPAEEESGWSMIPHIFASPFYCYAYAFGNILVFALYNRYRTEGKPFIESYKDILRAGGSERPRELLARHGFDITSPEFYKSAIREIEGLVVEFEGLAEGK